MQKRIALHLKVIGQDDVSLCIVVRSEDACSPRLNIIRQLLEYSRQQDALSVQDRRQEVECTKKICVHLERSCKGP